VRRFIPFLVLALASGLAATAGRRGFAALCYVRAAVLHGEVWRLSTTHLVHASVAHLGWNLAGLVLVALAVGRELSAPRWAIAALASGLGASLGVLLLSPRTAAMAGLSALLHGLLAAGGVAALRRDRRAGFALLAALAAKLAAERWGLWPATAALGRATAIDAHLYGAVAGVIAGLPLGSTPYRHVSPGESEQQEPGEVPARQQRDEDGPQAV
jgi:rhomboid family GlyGly-CTERM serine protease